MSEVCCCCCGLVSACAAISSIWYSIVELVTIVTIVMPTIAIKFVFLRFSTLNFVLRDHSRIRANLLKLPYGFRADAYCIFGC